MDQETHKIFEQLFDTKLKLLGEQVENSIVTAMHTVRKELLTECVAVVKESIISHAISCEGAKLAKSYKWFVRTLIGVLLTIGTAAVYKTFLG